MNNLKSKQCLIMREKIAQLSLKLKDENLRKTFNNCFFSTLDTTVESLDDGSTYVFTGDLPAMWLRDSSAQVIHYLPFCNIDIDVKNIISGLIKRQMMYISIDPYTNAFNKNLIDNVEFSKDDTNFKSPWIWERKYELDSLCYPIWLSYHYFLETNDKSIFDEKYINTIKIILDVFCKEQHHMEKSDYYHMRNDGRSPKSDSLENGGKGNPVAYTGMIFSGYRPSDDACKYGYLVPSNMFAVVVLGYLLDLIEKEILPIEFKNQVAKLLKEVNDGINNYAVLEKDEKKYYAYEVDGLGNSYFMDDANVPSLLASPYLGFCNQDDLIYKNTRNLILSKFNPYYFEGKCAKGVGSPHTPNGYIWHIGLCVEALTTSDSVEIARLIDTLQKTDAGTNFMHEGFNANNPNEFTRSWFAWANSMFALTIYEKLLKNEVQK